jgi:hypothetical protein
MFDNEGLKYDVMVERALRGVLRDALCYVIDKGLPGEHHFYITFRTEHPGVEIPDHLRARYPSEMTIVLQHQFWGLQVDQETFAVTLSFSDVPEHLKVPFDAVVAFADPSVRFGLQFEGGEGEGAEKPSAEVTALPVDRPAISKQADKIEKAARQPAGGRAAKARAAKKASTGKAADEAEIVPLDTFRKK